MKLRLQSQCGLCLVGLYALSACGSDIPDLNNPSLSVLRDNPTRTLVGNAATGLLIGHRAQLAQSNGYIVHFGILGRELYYFGIGSDPRFVSEMLQGSGLNPGSPAFGGNFWRSFYANQSVGHVLLNAVDVIATGGDGMTSEEKNATRGFARTIMALDLMTVLSARDKNGIVLDNSGGSAAIGEIACKDRALRAIAAMLDQANDELGNSSEAFPFPLGAGFSNFGSPTGFRQVNRGLAARVAVYRGEWAAALTSLANSFVEADATKLKRGVFNVYGPGAGDVANGLINPNIFVHPSVVSGAECRVGFAAPCAFAELDSRVTAKVVEAPDAKSFEIEPGKSISSQYTQTAYSSSSSPIPIIRNEELLLLRAEANFNLGRLTEAAADINLLRSAAGLSQLAEAQAATADEILKQRRYALLFEAHRWVDMRRAGRLAELQTLDQVDSLVVHDAFPIPTNESNARGGDIACVP